MRSEKDRRTLICYAGSASEASIGSKPLGSELVVFICLLRAKSQHFVDWWRTRLAPGETPTRTQHTENIGESAGPSRLGGTEH